jgi:hypothetical protein
VILVRNSGFLQLLLLMEEEIYILCIQEFVLHVHGKEVMHFLLSEYHGRTMK